jgi:5-methylcytosine-specific restriction endonuclease McrA
MCGRKSNRILEVYIPAVGVRVRACFASENNCYKKMMQKYVLKHQNSTANPDIYIREIEYNHIEIIKPKKQPKKNTPGRKRRSISLSTRYKVLRRDGFQCAVCGASGAGVSLEVDHIVPWSKGGSNNMDNLQTLCFKCNRGKGQK